ncbi:25750_t:CDS:2 [Dentiscutata erythropus]|uniref:25750_t:CDS:1 n=1 Tax=Dentiscutata erythropus TaxID=1348616 RepID=A0A9N9CNW5_9GLOM|nr:25750_t:CDS:2 [Dentiscutata erythropus]
MATLNHLQRDAARLPDVLHSFAYFMQLYKNKSDRFSKNMVQRLETWWSQWKQPLLLLSFFLHPAYPWFKTKPVIILSEFSKFMAKEYPFDDETASNFANIQEYWDFSIGATKELGMLAICLFSICINSASCERLFSTMGFFHNSRRTRLLLDKVFSMAQMRAEIKYKRIIEAAKSLEQNILANINIIYSSDDHRHKQPNSHDIEQKSSDVIDLESSDVIDLESSDIIKLETNKNEEMIIEDDSESSVDEDISEEWKAVLKEWSEGLISEEESIEEYENLFGTDELEKTEETEDLSFNELLIGLKHPADDVMEKWKLANLFDFEFSTLSSIKNQIKIQDDSK